MYLGQKLSPEQTSLYRQLDEILWKDWDPIGVHGIEQARDEYYSYLPDVLQLVQRRASAEEIAHYLHGIATDRMGLTSNLDHHLDAARKIHQLEQSV